MRITFTAMLLNTFDVPNINNDVLHIHVLRPNVFICSILNLSIENV